MCVWRAGEWDGSGLTVYTLCAQSLLLSDALGGYGLQSTRLLTRKLRLRAPGVQEALPQHRGTAHRMGLALGLLWSTLPGASGSILGSRREDSQRAWVTPRAAVQPSVRPHSRGDRILRRSSWTPRGTAWRLLRRVTSTHGCSEGQARG